MLKSAKEILKERGIDLDKKRKEKMRELDDNTIALVRAITEWLEKQPADTELLVLGVDKVKGKSGLKFYDKKIKNDDGTVTVCHHLDYLKEKYFMPGTRLRALGFSTYRPIDDKDYVKYAGCDPHLYVWLPTD